MGDLAAPIAVLACTFFTGAALYVTLVEHPARLACGTEVAATEWVPSYKRAAVMQASLALLATAAGLVRWVAAGGGAWLLGTLLVFSVVPFTLIVVSPTNRRLLEPGRDRRSEETRRLLTAWGRLHAVRTALGLAASILFVWAAGHP
jgi:hypothetical protein